MMRGSSISWSGEHIDCKLTKPSGMSLFTFFEAEFWPPERLAIFTGNESHFKSRKPDRAPIGMMRKNRYLALFFDVFPTVVIGTALNCTSDIGMVANGSINIFRGNVLDFSEAKGMIGQ